MSATIREIISFQDVLMEHEFNARQEDERSQIAQCLAINQKMDAFRNANPMSSSMRNASSLECVLTFDSGSGELLSRSIQG